MKTLSLQDQTAIVTGGGSGIGAAIAIRFGELGMRVMVCGRRLAPLEATVSALNAAGGQGRAVQADVSQQADVEAVVRAAQELSANGAVDVLVNNAGVGGGGPIHRHSVETWDRVMAINLRGPFLFARGVLPLMRDQGRGHIVNISSESGIEYYPGNGVYGVTKHALNALGEFIQRENQDYGVRVDTICPGMVITEMTEHSSGLNHEKSLQADEIADLVEWLVTRQPNLKIGTPILIQTMLNPWE